MQIYADAMSASRVGDIQYVLQNSLQMERTCNKERVLELLESGWNITGKFNNGAGYENYKIENETHIDILINFLNNKFECPTSKTKIIILSFQEFYNYDYQSEGMNVDITFWNEQMQHDNLRLDGERAKDIRDFLVLHLFVKQDKDSLIDLLEKELSMKE